MADFNQQLTGVQGVGARSVAPVQPTEPVAQLGNIASIFTQGLVNNAKQEALSAKNAILEQYNTGLSDISNAIATGGLRADEAASRIRMHNSKMAASYPQFVDDFKSAYDFHLKGTDAGKAVDEETARIQRENSILQEASSAGYHVDKDTSPVTKQNIINAYRAEKRAKEAMAEHRAAMSEYRAQAGFDKDIAEKSAKEANFKLITSLASSRFSAIGDTALDLASRIRSGKLSPEQASVTLSNQYSEIAQGISAVAGVDQSIAAPYRTLLEGIYKDAQALIKPGADAESLENQLKARMTAAKLAATANPKNLAAITLGQVLPNSIAAQMLSGNQVGDIFAAVSSGQPAPVIGTEAEGTILKILKESVKKLGDGKSYTDQQKALLESSTSVDTMLKELGSIINTGKYDVQKLVPFTDFIASPEYIALQRQGKISQEGVEAGRNAVMASLYPTVTSAVNKRMQDYLYQSAFFKSAPWEMKNFVDVTFDGSNVKIVTKNNLNVLDASERESLTKGLAQLKTSEAAIGKLIKLTAHLDGTDDYKKTFDAYKHVYFPTLYSGVKGLEIGDVVPAPDGTKWRFKGGDDRDRSNWVQVNGTGK